MSATLAPLSPSIRTIQTGSALAYRGIPLQSAYCAAKHAIKGFTESIRTELLHEGSDIKITMVQLPAVNTARPIPPLAPVTTTTLSFSTPDLFILSVLLSSQYRPYPTNLTSCVLPGWSAAGTDRPRTVAAWSGNRFYPQHEGANPFGFAVASPGTRDLEAMGGGNDVRRRFA